MRVRFLLGPSGSGKTYRCLAEVRRILLAAPEGPPLLFLAPKQATFQLERQLLADPFLAGYTRLQILSFERLAEYILTEFAAGAPQLLSEEGRLMVLRALLAQNRGELKLFHATARLRGFAQKLSGIVRELQRAQFTPERLRELADKAGPAHRLDAKLHDLAVMFQAYLDWLKQHQLQDHDRLLALAAEELLAGGSKFEVQGSRSVISDQLSVISGEKSGGSSQLSLANSVDAKSTDYRSLITDHCLRFAGLWLDGFAELSPQEMALLIGLLPFCECATLALNLERESIGQTSWLSTWSMPSQTYRQIRQRLEANPRIELLEEWLERDARALRFADNPTLYHLERHWSDPKPPNESLAPRDATHLHDESATVGRVTPCTPVFGLDNSQTVRGGQRTALPASQQTGIRITDSLCVKVCTNPEAEALLAAREIRRFARAGGRFRDAAVIVRNLERYHDPVRRVFTSYGIPFFLDRREPVGHHPLAELTRSALKTVAFDWSAEDWFAALKTGLVHPNEDDIDRLENEALARGWKGKDWQHSLRTPEEPELERWLDSLREKLARPFQRFAAALGPKTSGPALADALRTLWRELRVEDQLARWSGDSGNAVHVAFWEQMQNWLDNVALAFANESLPLREWLSVVDTGLSSQTVGIIPPTLDQVLVGAVDRSRNPELRLAVVLGVNESVFPAPPPSPTLLTEPDRERLSSLNAPLGRMARDHLSLERYLGYIAFTRARERLVLTYALRDENDVALNPSPFIVHLRRLFPDLEVEPAPGTPSLTEADHPNDVLAPVIRMIQRAKQRGIESKFSLRPTEEQTDVLPPYLCDLVESFLGRQNADSALDERLSPAVAEQLYGSTLQSSVSRMEEFAACPFRFFVRSGLRVEERKRFELDVREQGSFQHAVLARFHEELQTEGKRWRDLAPGEGRRRIATIGEELMLHYQKGLLVADDQSRFTTRSMTAALEDFIEVILAWMPQYQFDPSAVELGFGQEGNPLPAWKLDLGGGRQLWFRGQIDRIDLARATDGRSALGVVIDYKSSAKKLDPVLVAHGIQMQLLAYLNVLRGMPEAARHFKLEHIIPAGVFYVNLRGGYPSTASRRKVLAGIAEARKRAYQHTGRFEVGALPFLDRRGVAKGDQFAYELNKRGALSKRSREGMDSVAFHAMLDAVEAQLAKIGRDIFAGVAAVDPYRKGSATACDTCCYQGICRIDPRKHPYRVLRVERVREDSK